MARAAGLLAALVAAAVSAAQPPGPPVLDFSTVGFYGAWLELGDFAFLKFTYRGPQDEPHLKAYARMLKAAAAAGQKVILGVYTFDRVTHKRPVEEYVTRTDALLGALPRELIYAACPSEENVTWNNGLKVLNALYDCIRGKWGLRCYQWLTMPDPPHGKLKADGWILDAYGWGYERFRRHLAKFVLTGKPVVVCVNATPPSARHAAEKVLPGEPGSAAEDQMRVCEEFNLPVFFYAVDRRWGNVHAWLRDDDDETVACRRWAMEWIERAHGLRGRARRAASADYLPSRPLEVCGGRDNTFAITYDFPTAAFVNYAGVEGLTRLRWDGMAETLTLAAGRRPLAARLYWHLSSPLTMTALAASAKAIVEGRGAKVRVLVGKDIIRYFPAEAAATSGRREVVVDAHMPDDWSGREAWVMVELAAPSGGRATLAELTVTGSTKPPAEKVVRISPGPERDVVYRDDFVSQRLIHFAEVDRPDELRWKPGSFYITGRRGGANVVRIKMHFVSDRPIADGEVRVGALAWTRAHRARIVCGLSANGRDMLVMRDTARLPQDAGYGRFSGVITLPLAEAPQLKGARNLWLIIEMVNASGVRAGPSNVLHWIEVVARAGAAGHGGQ